MAHEDDELEDDNSLENDFLSGEVLPNDIGDDSILDEDEASSFGSPADDNDDILDEDEDSQDDNEDEDGEDEEDEEGEDAEGKDGKNTPADDADGSEAFLRGSYWKETGKLPADLEIPKDIDDIALEDLYLKQVEKNVINRIKTEIKETIQAKGLDPDEIFNNESEDEYYQKEYARIASIPYDMLVEKNDDVTAALKILGTEYWISKSKGTLTEEDVEANVLKDLDKMDEEDLYAKYQKYFGAEAQRLEIKIKEDSKEKVRVANEKAKADAEYIKKKLAEKYTAAEAQKVLNAMTKKDHIYDDGKGTRKPVTLFEKKRMEAERTLDGQLQMALHLILGIDEETIKEKSERVGAQNLLQKLAKVPLSGKPGNKSKGHKKNTVKQQEFESMLLD